MSRVFFRKNNDVKQFGGRLRICPKGCIFFPEGMGFLEETWEVSNGCVDFLECKEEETEDSICELHDVQWKQLRIHKYISLLKEEEL